MVSISESQPRALFSFDYQIKLEFDRRSIVPCLVSVYIEEPLPTDTIKIGFFGGAGEPDISNRTGKGVSDESLDFARRTAAYIANYNKKNQPKILPITGAAPGNPHAFAETAYEMGTHVIGLSPFYDEVSHLSNGSQINAYSAIIYMGQDKDANFNSRRGKERMNVQFAIRDNYNILAIHAGIYCGGSIGTLQELVVNIMSGKDAALARGTGGVADNFPGFYRNVRKDTGSRIIISNDPIYIVNKLIDLQEKRKEGRGKRQKLFVDDLVTIINREIKRKKSIS